MKIVMACDHAGLKREEELKKYFEENGIEVLGTNLNHSDVDDYPDFALELCKTVLEKNILGILICGNGIGMSIAANKINGIRCARVYNADDAFKCKNHNGANVIAIGANLDIETTKEIVDTFMVTKPASEERHLRRIEKINKLELGE